VLEEIRKRLREEAKPDRRGDFAAVHACPFSAGEVPDEPEARLVLGDPEHPHIKDEWTSAAAVKALAILDSRGASPRGNRNAVVFLAADKARLEALESAARFYLAWHSIEKDQKALNLDPFQVSQVETKVKESDDTVRARIPEAYVWILIPEQERKKDAQGEPTTEVDPQGRVVWQNERLQPGPEALAIRASRKLKGAESLLTSMGATRLRMELDRIPLWRGDHVSLRQLTEDFGRYLYLPRLKSPDVLRQAIEDGLENLTWAQETFAFAEGWDEQAHRYLGLRSGKIVQVDLAGEGLLVKPLVASQQMADDAAGRAAQSGSPVEPTEADPGRHAGAGEPIPPTEPPVRVLRRFHGSVGLDPTRTGRDAGRIADEVLGHLTTLKSARVTVILEIQAEAPEGVPDGTVRTVTENCRTLKFKDHGFEEA
jgi:hypothetical protein